MAINPGFSLRELSQVLLKLTTNHRAKKIASKWQIDWSGILPLGAIAQSTDEKIRRFRELQLRQRI